MIDLRLVRTDPQRVRASQQARGEPVEAVDALLAADEARRSAVLAEDTLRAEQKSLSQQVGKAGGDERDRLRRLAGELSQRVAAAGAVRAEADAALRAAHLAVPNVVEDGAPPGGEQDFVVLREVGSPGTYDFAVRDHVELGQLLGAIDTDRGAKVSGARFFYLTGPGALLELALLNFAVSTAVGHGFTPMIPPVLVGPQAMEGTGFLGAHAAEVYRLEADDLYLVGTSEVPLAGYHAEEILPRLPVRYAAWSSCFRREAGSYGRDTRGIIRVHQFDKVEMFVWCDPADAAAEHLRLLAYEEEVLAALEIPYRVIDVAAGDLGSSAARKYDCEAWLPSQQAYREVTSASNCTDFQARRLGTRFRSETGTAPVATLNGTLIAMARTIVALLETHQQADGSVRVPPVLRPWLGRDVLEPVAPVRLVATDLDGTLVRSDGSVSARTREALAACEAAGYTVVMATGRPPRWMGPVADLVGHHGLALCSNGAVLYDLHSERIVAAEAISATALAAVVTALAEEVPDVVFAVERAVDGATEGFHREHSYVPLWEVGEHGVLSREDLVAAPAVKLLVRAPRAEPEALYRAALGALGSQATITRSSSDELLEISSAGVTKASGLARFAAAHGLTAADTVAFGDMPNDLPMLAWAGWSVAVANAHPEVLALADEVTATNDDDGVARVLERLLTG